MCGRYNITDNSAVHLLLQELGIDIGPLPTRYNIAPTEAALTIFHDDEVGYTIGDMRWWLTPFWSDGPSQKYSMFNAKAETIDTSRAYRGPFRHHRAIIPATSFIEWQKQGSEKQGSENQNSEKQPYEIKPVDGCFYFAAVWDQWTDGDALLYSCAIVTTSATKSYEEIHPRQPVMLSLKQAKRWLDPRQGKSALQLLMQPSLPGELSATPVSRDISSPLNKQPVEYTGEPLVI